jgi:glycosyltransferase involved in cell wall biosynthesis
MVDAAAAAGAARQMSALLFYDPVCQQPYDTRTLRNRAMGGTEATLVRVADALGAWVMQHNRTEDWQRYLRPQPVADVTAVIVARDSRALPFVREHYPQARVYLWLHDRFRPGGRRARWLAGTAPLLRELAVTAVCVSDWQRRGVEATLRQIGVAETVRAVTIYNAVDDGLMPDDTPVDERKLVFFSSPNKGLDFTLDAFSALKRAMPDLRLVVGNPGYKADRSAPLAGVELLGAQPQVRMHSEVRSALCTFFPNFVIPETFGLVFAESHALGTPVLTHDCGAALEVLGDPQQVLPLTRAQRLYESAVSALPSSWRARCARLAADFRLFDAHIERVRSWRAGARPRTVPDPRFRLSAVTAQWRALLAA